MRVLYVSKASVVPAYRDKLRVLAGRVDVDVLVPRRWGSVVTEPGAQDLHARLHTGSALLHGSNHLHVYPAAAGVLRAVRPDIVHLDEEAYSAVTFQFARLCGRERLPFVFFAWQNLDKPIPLPFAVMRRRVLASAAGAIAGTARAAAVLRASGWNGPTAVIPQLGVDPERFCPDPDARAAARVHVGLPEAAFVVGFAGRLAPEKGVDVLIDAVAAVDGMHLLVIGAGRERRRLERRAAERGMTGRSRFIGAVESLAMPRWLNALDALVLPSRSTRGWTEQFGRVLVEAMACGVPALGARSGEIGGVLGDAGITFAEGSAGELAAHLAGLRDDDARRRSLAAAGRARVLEHFTNDRIVEYTVAFYETLLSARRPIAARTGHAVADA